MDIAAAHATLTDLFMTGIGACDPARVLAPHLQFDKVRAPIVLAVGKAAIAMARVAERLSPRPPAGLVVARAGERADGLALPVIASGHPLSDAQSLAAGLKLLELAGRATAKDDVIVLLSGGASALACAPSEGLTLDEKRRIAGALIASGAVIEDINAVRRHLSRLKGGRLAAAAFPARVRTFAMSDVVSDKPEAIGSGPTVGDPTTIGDARGVLAKYRIGEPSAGWSESVKPGDARLAAVEFKIIVSAALALAAISARARALGFAPVILGTSLEGEARRLGAEHAAIARGYADEGARAALISGGELTVTLRGEGRGGPNFEYAAALALGIAGRDGVYGLAADSDGIDGNSGAAGAFADGAAGDAARAAGRPLEDALARNDCASAFDAIGATFRPGPTGVNVNDFRIILTGAGD